MGAEKKPKKDKRSERTRALISKALQALLQKEAFSGITVNDICVEAEVSRATFYLYFEDKYMLLRFTMGRWGDDISQLADTGDLRSLVDVILETLHAHRKMIHNILEADKNEEVRNMLHTDFVQVMSGAFEKHQAAGAVLQVPEQVLSIFCAAGTAYLLVWWLEGGIKATKDEMCEYLMKLAEGKAIVEPKVLKQGLPSYN